MNAVTDIFTILCFICLFLFVNFTSEDCVSCNTEMADVILKVIGIEISTHLCLHFILPSLPDEWHVVVTL